MADSTFQISSKPKLYISHPLWQYASGGMGDFEGIGGSLEDLNEGSVYLTAEEKIKLIKLYPSDYLTFPSFSDSANARAAEYVVTKELTNPDGSAIDTSNIWNFDYAMILGHNFASTGTAIRFQCIDNFESQFQISTTNIVNHQDDGIPEYDGWSLLTLNDQGTGTSNAIRIVLMNGLDTSSEIPIKIGSLMFGNSYEFPINCSINTTTKFDYGVKQKQTLNGRTISTANWTKPSAWVDGNEPFGLGTSSGEDYGRRSGRRSWTMEFDSLAPSKVMNQNMMLNDNNYTNQDNQSAGAADGSSLYNIYKGVDFYTNVIHRCMASHLPLVLQIDKDNNSADQFAIVRLNRDFQITQKTPNLYSIKVSFTEQI